MTGKQYLARLRRFTVRVASALGSDVSGSSTELRCAVMAVLCVVAVLIKLLVDAGLLTSDQVAAALTAAEDDLYEREPTNPTQGRV